MRRLRRVGVRQRPRARFRRAAIASAAVRPHGQGVSVPGLACNATRHGSASMDTGGSPIAAWPQESARQPPRRLPRVSPHPMRSGPSCLWRGVCPRDIAISAIAALDCALRRPRRLQPTTLPVAALWMAAPYHAVTNASRGELLANSLPPLARRPLLPPVTTRFPPSAPDRRPGSDRHAHPPHPSLRRSDDARGASRRSQGGTTSAP